MAISANRLELLQIADAVAREKSIDKQIVISAMEEAIQKAAKSRYGQENEIKAEIDPKTGETRLHRLRLVVEKVENESTEITLDEAQFSNPAAQTGDLIAEPLGQDRDGNDVYLRDLWPTADEIQETITRAVRGEMFSRTYADVFTGDPAWRELPIPEGDLFDWDPASTYVRQPPYFEGMSREPEAVEDVHGARCLVVLGDSVTTDHISPAGSISPTSPAGKYLVEHGVERKDFNSYGSRRGNHEVMVRGTFANVRLRNLMVPGSEGTVTLHVPSGDELTIYDASERYLAEGTPLIVIAGKEYGSGSSRDWAAKGPNLLGLRAVIAESYERIHRSNLLMMGILPLQFLDGETPTTLGLTGREEFAVEGVDDGNADEVTVRADGKEFRARVRLDTPREREYFQHGGILPYVLRRLLGT